MTVWVGTSGWQYKSWRGRLYPKGLPTKRWLEHYATAFPTVEVNASFYRLPRQEAVKGWRDTVAADFVFAVKASRYLTHVRRLQEPEEPVRRLMTTIAPLESTLGPVLVQLPPTMRCAPDRLDETLACFPPGVRVAVEPRHESWWSEEVSAVLARHQAAWVDVDRDEHAILGPEVTGRRWSYVRLHAGCGRPRPCYRPQALTRWADRIAARAGRGDVYLYFNNDPEGCAVEDARTLMRRLDKRGVDVARTPVRATR